MLCDLFQRGLHLRSHNIPLHLHSGGEGARRVWKVLGIQFSNIDTKLQSTPPPDLNTLNIAYIIIGIFGNTQKSMTDPHLRIDIQGYPEKK